jgi:ribose 5-phosphate isomerase B
MRVGIAADHGGFKLKGILAESLRDAGFEVVDFGSYQLNPSDDYPDIIVPLAKAVAAGDVERGVALCGSGVGSTIAANKVTGVRAGLINRVFCAHQGVEDDDMNVCCLGGKVVGAALAWELVQTFLAAKFSGTPRHARRVAKVQALENRKDAPLRAHSKRPNRLARTADTIGYMGNNHENSDQSDRETARHGTEPVVGQHHQEPVNQRDVEPLYSGALGNGTHLEPHDLRPRDQE